MNTSFRRIVLAVTVLLGLFVGLWAEIAPRAFYDSFPGFGLHWIDAAGAYDEHLIRDVGSLYLALAAASLAAVVARTAAPGRVVGLAWSVFGVLHFGYHVLHLEGSTLDRVGNVVSLGLSLVLGLLLLPPSRRRGEDAGVDPRTAEEAR
jgi:hypothetical protein